MNILRAFLILLFFVPPAYAQVQCAQAAKLRHPNLAGNRSETHKANIEVAWCSGHGQHGLFVKTSGNQCEGYSCDIICTKNRNGWDIWVSWDTEARPAWQPVNNLDPARCELVTSDPGGGGEIPPTTDDLKAIRIDVAAIRKLLEEWPR